MGSSFVLFSRCFKYRGTCEHWGYGEENRVRQGQLLCIFAHARSWYSLHIEHGKYNVLWGCIIQIQGVIERVAEHSSTRRPVGFRKTRRDSPKTRTARPKRNIQVKYTFTLAKVGICAINGTSIGESCVRLWPTTNRY